jgi:hypothetical protein
MKKNSQVLSIQIRNILIHANIENKISINIFMKADKFTLLFYVNINIFLSMLYLWN